MTSSLMSPSLWSVAHVCAAVEGIEIQHGPQTHIDVIDIDSRASLSQGLFIPLKGQTVDGHAFIPQACAQGAHTILVEADWWRTQGHTCSIPNTVTLIQVENTTQALWQLGVTRRQALHTTRLAAITGSVGKTTTKSLLAHILSCQGRTNASAKSFNTKYGVPLSLARTPVDAQYGVFEIGMSTPGEIAPLSHLVAPHVGMITMIAPAHLEGMKTLEAIADEKLSIQDGLLSNGVMILNADMPLFDRIYRGLKHPCQTVGTPFDADLRLISATSRALGQTDVCGRFRDGTEVSFLLPLSGHHNAMNALMALCAARALGADPKQGAHDLASFVTPSKRGEIETLPWPTAHSAETISIIDESYNANPTSVRAALKVLSDTGRLLNGRRVAILGDMFELGPQGPAIHAALSDDIQALGIECVITCGTLMTHLARVLPSSIHGGHLTSSTDNPELWAHVIKPGDVVMIKGSRGMAMERALEQLKASARGPTDRHAPCEERKYS